MTGHADLDRRIRAGGSDLRRSQRQGASSHNDQRYLLRDLHMHGHFDTGPLQMLNRCAHRRNTLGVDDIQSGWPAAILLLTSI
jgi:hypothetical protein